ncbi:glycosyl hydrolase family 8 [Kitasatospora sp. NPDC051853]|uniref:glycosyl hydrolase family 8 n=1 Tax=Kitasatospora sp. NPDC051853 TaxID=3364058 RepID=UPI0037A032EA
MSDVRRTVRTTALALAAAGLVAGIVAVPGTATAAATRYEAESAALSQGVVEANHLNYSGTGFVNGDNVVGSWVEFTVNAATAGTANLTVRYANGSAADRTADLAVNGTVVQAARSFPSTGNWDTWADSKVSVQLKAGANKVRLTSTTANGLANLDYLDADQQSTPPTGGPAVPFGSHQFAYAAGTLKPSGAQGTLDQQVLDKYNSWKSAFLKQNCGNGWYQVISPDADHPYVAEGQGYGMVITALMAGADPNAKAAFDGLLKFVLAHPSVNNKNLLAAEQDVNCKSVNGSDSATDGDMDVAYGLLLADRQWGSAGTYNYKDLAVKHINAIKASEVNPTTKLLLLGDWSSSGDQYYYVSRSSDWMIDHFRAFKKATGDAGWDAIRTAHQNLITSQQTKYAASTGLLADFVVNTNTTPKPAPGEVLESPNDGDYGWNACRDPWRIGADAVTSGDAASLASVRKMNSWIKSKTGGNANAIVSGYKLSGTAFDSGNDMAFTAPFAVAAMTDPGSQAWLDALWAKMVATPITPSVYYGGSVQLQTMIVASGNYWTP